MVELKQAPRGADSLQWRVDASFDNYVRNQTGDGTVTVSAGASRDHDGYYYFPRIDTSSGSENLHFGGAVEFRAYMGVLSLRIADPSFHISQDMVRMYIMDDAAPAGTRLELATATLEPGQVGPAVLDLRLTERGSELFFGKYPAGTTLAPATVLLPGPAISMASTEGAH
ncbi:HtaA domain-containing protein [Arthrobacter sp. PAMC25564]|uniref:HtaA domain-containing protein n=1 Tax=Arthrobacter sp. PAMC25564 TaxID=2565366 RepID=UPI001445CA2E|nr:HtaA domain-containing protein [Arthrobacter sp. PAMC25564]